MKYFNFLSTLRRSSSYLNKQAIQSKFKNTTNVVFLMQIEICISSFYHILTQK
ncbi:hypothetical protein MtrunA17_Chr1g0167591 [Medicago truncatula]|uniref:Uncharacterized protein n=1 Tax=Medicago truncatula TaxID=3880 RepID=A0A396JK25_MEDTR|nr:hypothetical protein MtrunA17_Chr1g0167591 [Medicago truncatula]